MPAGTQPVTRMLTLFQSAALDTYYVPAFQWGGAQVRAGVGGRVAATERPGQVEGAPRQAQPANMGFYRVFISPAINTLMNAGHQYLSEI